ncbi:MAG: hypothetical protein ACOY4O_04490 [Pseudomonadota bacterium]|jgi:hypothetical protein
MTDDLKPYRFHVHKHLDAWRLVIRADRGFPPETSEDQWTFTRARAASDTNPDIRSDCDSKGYCLFKIRGEFAQLDAEMAARKKGRLQ